MTQRYSPEVKAAALARVAAGETISGVARDMGIERTLIHKWLERGGMTAVTEVVTGPTHGERLQQQFARLLDASLTTLIRHAEHYGSDEWLAKDPAVVLESTRTLGARLVAVMDRLGGRGGRSDDSDG